MIIKATAPMRIDFAGGTLDITPFYMWEGFGLTVGAAINRLGTASLYPRIDSKITITSKDINKKVEFDKFNDVKDVSEFKLLTKLIRFYKPSTGFDLIIEVDAPFSSGLGGSSAITMAASGALNKLVGGRYTLPEILFTGHWHEVQIAKALDGRQELYAAAYGGFNALWMEPPVDHRLEKLKVSQQFLEKLQNRLVLCYTGPRSQNSGMNNWAIVRGYVEGNAQVRESIRKIRDLAVDMRDAICKEDIGLFVGVLYDEWQNRKQLAPEVTTPRIERMIQQANSAGAMASKVCGAGGGGCMVVAVEKGTKHDVEEALINAGGEILNFKFTEAGLVVNEVEQ